MSNSSKNPSFITQAAQFKVFSLKSQNYIISFLGLITLLITLCLPSEVFAQVDVEQLVGSTCPAAGKNAADWDTVVECTGAGASPWVRAPYFPGSTPDTCDSTHGGMMQWTGAVLQYCNGTSWTSFGTNGPSTSLSGLHSATGSNTYDNAAYAQSWTWNNGSNAMSITSSSLTNGNLMVLQNTNTTGNGAVLNILSNGSGGSNLAIKTSQNGTNNTGYAGYFSNSSPNGYGVYSAGTAANNFAGTINIASGKTYKIGGSTAINFPNGDLTSIAGGIGALNGQSGTSQYNTAYGTNALYTNSSGTNNTGVGYQALYSNSTSSYNTAAGFGALYSATSGPNDAFGYQAGYYITSGTANVAFGYQSLLGVVGTPTTGTNNTAVGSQALTAVQGAASNNTGIGYQVLYTITTTSGSTALGYQALNASTVTNDALGYQAGFVISSGANNVAIGYQTIGSGAAALTGSDNTAIGYKAQNAAKTTANSNTAIGYNALFTNTTGNENTAIGWKAVFTNSSANNNTGVGYQALQNPTGTSGTGFGYQAGLIISTGTNNTVIGYGAVGSAASGLTGGFNTVVGNKALNLIRNAAANNTAIGYQAGFAGTSITTSSSNTYIGNSTQANSATAYSNSIALGNAASITASNLIQLGNSSITTINAPVAITVSDRRLKKDIVDLPSNLGIGFIGKLKPISYRFNNSDETSRYGFIAQDIEKALPPSLHKILRSKDPDSGLALVYQGNDKMQTYHVTYTELVAPIVKAIQQNQGQIESNEIEIIRLGSGNNTALRTQIKILTERLDTVDRYLYIIAALGCFCGFGVGSFLARQKRS